MIRIESFNERHPLVIMVFPLPKVFEVAKNTCKITKKLSSLLSALMDL